MSKSTLRLVFQPPSWTQHPAKNASLQSQTSQPTCRLPDTICIIFYSTQNPVKSSVQLDSAQTLPQSAKLPNHVCCIYQPGGGGRKARFSISKSETTPVHPIVPSDSRRLADSRLRLWANHCELYLPALSLIHPDGETQAPWSQPWSKP